MAGTKPVAGSPQAFPSGSSGHSAPHRRLLSISSHMSMKTAWTSSRPQKKWYVQRNRDTVEAPRPKNHACHGATVEMQGTPRSSQTSPTGFVMSGVDETRTRSTCSWSMKSVAAAAAAIGSDSVSRCRIWTGLTPAPVVSPAAAKCASSADTTKASASPNGARLPVCGVMYPRRTGRASPPTASPPLPDQSSPPHEATPAPTAAAAAAPVPRRNVRRAMRVSSVDMAPPSGPGSAARAGPRGSGTGRACRARTVASRDGRRPPSAVTQG
jgi:hypothetical protein